MKVGPRDKPHLYDIIELGSGKVIEANFTNLIQARKRMVELDRTHPKILTIKMKEKP